MTTATNIVFFAIFVSTINDNKMENSILNVNGLQIDDILKCLDLIEERVNFIKPYKTIEGCLNDIKGLNDIEAALHEFETGYEDVLERVWRLQSELRRIQETQRFWDKKNQIYRDSQKNTNPPTVIKHSDTEKAAIMAFNYDKRFTITE